MFGIRSVTLYWYPKIRQKNKKRRRRKKDTEKREIVYAPGVGGCGDAN
jgi:hypothetical protein